MDSMRAYGAGLAGGQFDINAFFRKPTVIFRSASLVLGALLWFSISKGGWHQLISGSFYQVCLYGRSSSTCSFASALGFFSMVGAAGLLFLDVRLDQISSIPTRRRAVLADLVVSACFAGIFVIAFFTFWSKYSSLTLDEPYKPGYVKFGILLALFSAMAWGGAAFFVWRRHEEGSAGAFDSQFPENFDAQFPAPPDGYGYGGSSDGIGAIGGDMGYQSGGAAGQQNQYQAGVAPPMHGGAPTNPFLGGDGYSY